MEKSRRFTEASVGDEPVGRLFVAAWPVGTTASEECNWQHGWAATIAKSQSVIIAWQHWWQGAGVRPASAGAAAHMATTASIKIAPFVLMRTVPA
jgi:hypothetical protein